MFMQSTIFQYLFLFQSMVDFVTRYLFCFLNKQFVVNFSLLKLHPQSSGELMFCILFCSIIILFGLWVARHLMWPWNVLSSHIQIWLDFAFDFTWLSLFTLIFCLFDDICFFKWFIITSILSQVILGEEVAASKLTIFDITKQICDAVQARAEKG